MDKDKIAEQQRNKKLSALHTPKQEAANDN
jgi:hypothetical protein